MILLEQTPLSLFPSKMLFPQNSPGLNPEFSSLLHTSIIFCIITFCAVARWRLKDQLDALSEIYTQ